MGWRCAAWRDTPGCALAKSQPNWILSVSDYAFHVISPGRVQKDVAVEIVVCRNDAHALDEACKMLGRGGDLDRIEVWHRDRKVVSLGGRPLPATSRRR